VIDTLKDAFMQGRLTEDEHDARAAQASASRSRAELAALTADLTARLPKASYGLTGVCVVIAAASVAAAIVLWQPDNYPAFALALFTGATLILAPPITVGLMVDARHQRRSGGQLPLEPALNAGG
jgi:hypothetical protein